MTTSPPSWVLPPAASATVHALAETLPCPVPVAALLTARGMTAPAAIRQFFNPSLDDLHDPYLLLGMTQAVCRIQHAVAAGEPILIYGDYDVDGTIATVLLKTAIERLASPDRPARVTYHVPHRLREGYGIQNVRLAEAAAAGVRLVISVDTGIRAFAAAEEARALGLDLIVTDHHLPESNGAEEPGEGGASSLPDALVVINPAQPGCPYPNKHLCGAGVAFKLAHALLHAQAATEGERDRLRRVLLPSLLKLVAIATIADVVPLTGENRAIAALGLRGLANPVQPGLRALMQVAKLAPDAAPSASAVGFRLAPRINAAGRMDVASDVVELFLTRDTERAQALAEKLDTLNTERRATEAAALEAIELQLLTLLDADGRYPAECLVLDHPEWHRGVLGILASRVVDRTHRPALVISTGSSTLSASPFAGDRGGPYEDDLPAGGGEAFGSGRSVPGFHLLHALESAHAQDDALFSRFGGHAHAAGFSLPSVHLTRLRERLRTHAALHLKPEHLVPALAIDLELEPEELNNDLCAWLERFAPFGQGNPEPVFLTRGLTLCAPPRIIKDRHISLRLAPAGGVPLSALGWSRTHQLCWPERIAPLGLAANSSIDAVFRLQQNRNPQYAGLELLLLDLMPSVLATKV